MCERCEFENTISRNSDNYFILLDLKYQLKCFLETAEIQQYLNSFNFNNDNENMTDVHDGQIFKILEAVNKPMLQNMTQFNGFYGCPYCYHSGKVINRQVKYPVAENCNQKRTPSEVVSDMENSSKSNKKVRGIKGAAASINLPSFNIVWGYSIDYMHAVLLGVVRLLVDIWTTYNYHTDNLMYIVAQEI
ncbi:hypothetical protein JTB14_019064 [Gonioctena quinquepunctata]|nr:hypothetical protein JTB14_019064 [Gonioctena quinquepunctata]